MLKRENRTYKVIICSGLAAALPMYQEYGSGSSSSRRPAGESQYKEMKRQTMNALQEAATATSARFDKYNHDLEMAMEEAKESTGEGRLNDRMKKNIIDRVKADTRAAMATDPVAQRQINAYMNASERWLELENNRAAILQEKPGPRRKASINTHQLYLSSAKNFASLDPAMLGLDGYQTIHDFKKGANKIYRQAENNNPGRKFTTRPFPRVP